MPHHVSSTRISVNRAESSDAANTHATATKTRRSHRKSRNGCIECKQRHIRCDERKPSCANCEIAEHTCSFLTPQAGRAKQSRGQRHRGTQQHQPESAAASRSGLNTSNDCNAEVVDDVDEEHIELLPSVLQQRERPPDVNQAPNDLSLRSLLTHNTQSSTADFDDKLHRTPYSALPLQLSDSNTPPADCYPGLSGLPETMPKAIFTPEHMILLHHAARVPNLNAPNRNVVEIAIRYIIRSPYLIDEVLAFTAFHMAHAYPGSETYFRHLATELQTRGLNSFNRLTKMVPIDDEATAVPRFLFSGILGRHVLADTLTHCNSDFQSFIDRFVECINLSRGIMAITPPAWEYLNRTEMQPFLGVVREAEKKIISPGTECDALSRLMDDSDLNETTVLACRQVIEVLQRSFDLCHRLDEGDYPQAVSTFSVRLEVGFLDVLRKHQPEALVILAYYGVLLYRCRGFWAFTEAGASMIRAISTRLGSYWQEALTWPLHVLEAEYSEPPLL